MAISFSRTVLAAALLCSFVFKAAISSAADWPQFGRDGTRNAVSLERNPPLRWDVGKTSDAKPILRQGMSSNIKWSAPLGSMTYGDPVVANGLVWVGTNNGYAGSTVDASVLACFRESDGKLLYRYVSPRLSQGRSSDWPQSAMAGSPLIEGDRMWFVTNRAEVVCLDIGRLRRDGGEPKLLWKVDLIGKFGVSPTGSWMNVAHLSSIAGYKDLIYVITGAGIGWSDSQVPNPGTPSLICFNNDTGTAVWQDHSPGPNILFGQWSSPTIIEISGHAQCVAPQGDGWVRSFDALTGDPLWQFDMNRKESRWGFGRRDRNIILSSPVFADNRIYLASGQHPIDGAGRGRLVCLDPTRRADISSELAIDAAGKTIPHRRIQAVDPQAKEKAVANPNSGLVWEFTQVGDGKELMDIMHGTVSNVAVHNGLVIATDFSGLVHCLDAKTGKRYWVHDWILSPIYASPLIVENKVYVVDGDGAVSIFGLSPDSDVALRKLNYGYEPLHKIEMGNPILSSPIFANGVLYVATQKELFAIAADNKGPNPELARGYWPQWRGPNRDNVSTETGLLKEWPNGGPPLLWTAVGLGDGIAPVSVAQSKIFTLGYNDQSEFAVALDEQTGKLSWSTRVGPPIAETRLMRWLSQRAPTVDADRLYALTARGDLVCLQTGDGHELWRISYPTDFGAKRPSFGFCDYPLVDGEKLICAPGGPDAQIVALDKKTGATTWRSTSPGSEDERSAHAALSIAEVGGLRQYVTFLSKGLIGVAADDGRFLWRYSGIGNAWNCHSPLVRGAQIFCSSGYPITAESGRGIALLQLLRDRDKVIVKEIYNRKLQLDPFQDSAVMIGDHVYTGQFNGAPLCINWRTGETTWGPIAVPRRGKIAIVSADGCLYYRHSDGEMTLAEARHDRYVQRGTFAIPDHEQSIGATAPVIAGRRLYLRDNNRLHCYDIRAQSAQSPAIHPREIQLAIAARAAAPPVNVTRKNHPPKGVFVPTPNDVVKEMLVLAKVKKSDVVFDLGSGDGRILIAAAKDYGCKAIGYEIDPELVTLSRQQAKTDGVERLVTIHMADLFTADLTPADVVTLYLLPQQNEKLLPQLTRLKPGSRIVSHQFEIPGMKPEKTLSVESKESGEKHTLFLYRLALR
jgi:outer membrane protein assembly factor BamB